MSLRDFILTRGWLKLFSLALASLLWFAIQSDLVLERRPPPYAPRPMETRDFRRPIAITTAAANRRLFKIEPNEVDIRLGGSPEQLRKLNPSDIQVHVKLTDGPSPPGSFPIEVSVPREVIKIWIWPSHAHIEPISQD